MFEPSGQYLFHCSALFLRDVNFYENLKYCLWHFRDNVHSHLCHAKRPMAVSFSTPTLSSKRPFRSGKIFQHFEGEVENIGLALCQYVTAAGFPPRPSQFFFNNRRVDRNIKNENDIEYVLRNLKRKQLLSIPSAR